MARSSRLRLSEVRQALRLVGECRDLGGDVRAWLPHAMRGVQQVLRANIVMGGLASAEGFRLNSELQMVLSVGWESAAQEKAAMDFLAGEGHLSDPAFQRFQAIARPNITLRPQRLVPRQEYEASDYYALRLSMGIDDMAFSQRESASKRVTFSLSPQRPPRDRPFSARECKLLSLLHDELAALAGNVLSDGADPLASLPPRVRQTLGLLLCGDSEKEAAARMGISRHTVHEYVVALYERFEVNSRAELMALCYRRGIGRPHGGRP